MKNKRMTLGQQSKTVRRLVVAALQRQLDEQLTNAVTALVLRDLIRAEAANGVEFHHSLAAVIHSAREQARDIRRACYNQFVDTGVQF